MINLLPLEEKEKFLLEKRKVLITIILVLVLYFLFCLIFILFSIKVYSQIQIEFQEVLLLRTEKGFGESEIKNFQEEIKETNLTLTNLNSFYQQQIYFSEVLERVSKILSQEMYLTNFSTTPYTLAKETGVKFSLSGFAPFRETLLEFKENLEKEKDFKEIYFPPTNWVKPLDIDFSVTFKVKQ